MSSKELNRTIFMIEASIDITDDERVSFHRTLADIDDINSEERLQLLAKDEIQKSEEFVKYDSWWLDLVEQARKDARTWMGDE